MKKSNKQVPETLANTGGCAGWVGVSVVVYFVHYVKYVWSRILEDVRVRRG
mgnify:CR=1 FL=1